jgi:TonB family protein
VDATEFAWAEAAAEAAGGSSHPTSLASDLDDASAARAGTARGRAGAGRPDLSAAAPADALSVVARHDTSPEGRLQRIFQEDAGRIRVESGLADPFFLDLGRKLLSTWQPEQVVTDKGLAGYLSQLGKSIPEAATTYLDQASSYGRTGSPVASGSAPAGLASLAAIPEGLTANISEQMAAARSVAEQSRIRHAALVRVVQRADGRLVSVELVRPSDDSTVDAQALRDIREAAAALPAPTPGALAGRPTVTSTWEFSLVVSITPPLPMIAVQFDEVLGVVDARLPLDRRVYKLVRLVSVD